MSFLLAHAEIQNQTILQCVSEKKSLIRSFIALFCTVLLIFFGSNAYSYNDLYDIKCGSSAFSVRNSFFSDSGAQIQSAQMKVNCVYESVFVPESTCTNLDGFDPAVNAFGRAITQNDRIEDSIYVILYQFGRFFHRFQSAAHGPAQPFHPGLECPPSGFIMP